MSRKKDGADGPSLRTNVPPPRAVAPTVPLRILTIRERATFTVLSSALVGTELHWVEGRSRPCPGAIARCALCRDGYTRRWKGYLHALEHRMGGRPVQVIVQLTTWSVDHCPGLVKWVAGLRGGKLDLWREGETKQGRLEARFQPAETPQGDLPVEVDVAAVLKHVFDGVSRIVSGTPGLRINY